uniref:Uncharacterized protein n=1 Tax=Amphimedon queenslandica TaxID=400682 RepID=A0A1X7THB6_AMPQE
MRSRTSAAYWGSKVAIMYSNLVTYEVIRLVQNCALTCANHSSGSAGHNVGSLRETVTKVRSETGEGEPWCDITKEKNVWVTNVKSEDLNEYIL